MYFLNDKHPKYEYAIYIRHGLGMPFIIEKPHMTYYDICNYLNEEAKRHERYNRIYYIDNKFFKNHYEFSLNGTYYKILRRPVADWEEIEEAETKSKVS